MACLKQCSTRPIGWSNRLERSVAPKTQKSEAAGRGTRVVTPGPGSRVVGEDLSGFDWSEADLTDAHFVDCVVVSAQLTGAILQGAHFERCRLVSARAAHVDAREANFEHCVLTDAATHRGLQLAFSRFEGARFSACDLGFARIDRCDMYDTTFEDCDLRGAVFVGANFRRQLGRKNSEPKAAFLGCNFHLAELRGADVAGCVFTRSRFRETDFTDADLERADLADCDLFGACLDGARLAEADLRGAEISGLDLTRLATREGLKIRPDQQHLLLAALGVDIRPD